MKIYNTIIDIAPALIIFGVAGFFGIKTVENFGEFISYIQYANFIRDSIDNGEKARFWFNSEQEYKDSQETLSSMKNITDRLAEESVKSSSLNLIIMSGCFFTGGSFLMKQKRKRNMRDAYMSYYKSKMRLY